MTRRLRVRAALVAVLVVAAAAACSGDDGDTAGGAPPSVTRGDGSGMTISPESTLPAVPDGAECEALQVILKPEAAPEEIADLGARIDETGGVVSSHLVIPETDSEPSLYLVAVETPEAGAAVGEALAGDPGVVSVVYPDQVC